MYGYGRTCCLVYLIIQSTYRSGILKLCKSLFLCACPVTSVCVMIRAPKRNKISYIIIAIKICILPGSFSL